MSYDATQPEMTDSWMSTYTGKRFMPLNPNPDDICIEDIGHHLSLQCRYAGACKNFLSVAQHLVLCSQLAHPDVKLEALMHDTPEAYLQDMIRPLKITEIGVVYKKAEHALSEVIAKKFNFIYPYPEAIKLIDNIVLFAEKRDFCAHPEIPWQGEEIYAPLADKCFPERLYSWSPEMAKKSFLAAFGNLQRTEPKF
jgi:5'-deoxynucleotidase YfbR-like HD superfamily hydrolase